MKEYVQKNTNIEIKIPSLDEWKLYKDIRLNALKNDPQAFGASFETENNRTNEEWKKRIKNSYESNNKIFVAKKSNKYVGMIGFYSTEPNSVKIYGVYVKKEYRGTGISSRLMESLLDELRLNKKIKNIKLMVNAEQKIAINIYKRFGFAEIKIVENVKMGDGKLHNEIFMKKEN